jgi:hypothetical protein
LKVTFQRPAFPVDPSKEIPAATTPQPVPVRTSKPARPDAGSAFAAAALYQEQGLSLAGTALLD